MSQTTTRIRAGFATNTFSGVDVWLSYAGTGTDILVTFNKETFAKAVERSKDHINNIKTSYGMGVLMSIDDSDNLYAFECVYDGMLIMPVVEEQELKQNKLFSV